MSTTLRYGIRTQVRLPLEEAIAATTEALKREGFGVLTTIDVRETLKEKIGADFQPYVILGACNPALAYAALQDDIDIGLLLPCNVTVREEGETSIVTILDPMTMAELSAAPGLSEIVRLAREKLERVLAALERGGAA